MKFLTAISFAVALCLAGSDGPLFPWINFIGLVPFAVCVVVAR